jgi:gamma-glutamylcyclotransferase (GGCT)/AIG2-like uncharacterized protein YtfP
LLMNQKIIFLFVYGTLLDENNSFAAYLRENSVFYCLGKIRGQLYDIGNYPGAVSATGENDFVYGSVYILNDAPIVLGELDDYEGFGNSFAQPNEFVRDLTIVESENGPIECWIYLYNHPAASLKRIKSGKYK